MYGNRGFYINRFDEVFSDWKPGISTEARGDAGVTVEQLDNAIALVKSQISDSIVRMFKSTLGAMRDELNERMIDVVTKPDIVRLETEINTRIREGLKNTNDL